MFGLGFNKKSDEEDKRSRGGRSGEASPLLTPSNASGGASTKYYFLGKGSTDYQGGASEAVRDADGGEVVEELPEGAHMEEFAPKKLGIPETQTPKTKRKQAAKPTSATGNGGTNRSSGSSTGGVGGGGGGGFWSKLLGRKQPEHRPYGEVGTLVRQRKAPVKIEPKVFFANERTFLAWMHLSVILAGASIAILAFSEHDENPLAQLYGVMILPVAIAFIIYSMYQYGRRTYMIRNKHPGPYEDIIGPTVLGVMLMISIVGQFALKLYSMSY